GLERRPQPADRSSLGPERWRALSPTSRGTCRAGAGRDPRRRRRTRRGDTTSEPCEISLTMTQLRAIEILLRKCIPDLAAAEIKSQQTHRYVVEVPPVLDRDEWQRKYG